MVAEGAKLGRKATVSKIVKGSPEPIRLGGIGEILARELEHATGIETRSVVLGHVVRGGTPTASDRSFATVLGVSAVNLAVAGGHGRMMVYAKNQYASVPLQQVAGRVRLVPVRHPLIMAAREIGVSFGDE